jgi:hypothetical protein
LAAAVVAVALLSGCSSWHQAGPSAEDVLQRKSESRLRIQVEGSETKVEVQSPRIEGDSLHGVVTTGPRTPADPPSFQPEAHGIALPIRAIRSVEVERFNAAKTAGLVLLVAAFAAGALAASYSGNDVYL